MEVCIVGGGVLFELFEDCDDIEVFFGIYVWGVVGGYFGVWCALPVVEWGGCGCWCRPGVFVIVFDGVGECLVVAVEGGEYEEVILDGSDGVGVVEVIVVLVVVFDG